MSDLVTGEAVVLDLRAAKLPSRALAVLLDLAVQFLAYFLCVFALLAVLPDLDGAAAAALMVGMLVFFLVALPVLVETLSRGRSLGKLALGLRVVRTDGGPVRFRHALVRGLVGVFEIVMLTGIPAVITSLISSEGRRLGDVFAGTLVVRERVPAADRGRPVLPPPPVMQALGSELVRLDLSAVPPGLWLAVRQLLSRSEQLDGEVALRMAGRLAGDLAQRIRWEVPPGLHPALYLGAVLTERQRREWARANAPAVVPPPLGAFGPAPVAVPAPQPVTPAPASAPKPVLGSTDGGFALPG
ncbi:RDD family protein [Kitasatospora sp. NPDC052896]|uniref:RDD family protein n=1 Tax=Kitasatospora sp. NPDC052896 TaxID=3364061 RepID=UPI0037C93993